VLSGDHVIAASVFITGKINDPSDFPAVTCRWDQKRLDYACQKVVRCRVMIRVRHSPNSAVTVTMLPAYKIGAG
jgi:hypothetical protein